MSRDHRPSTERRGEAAIAGAAGAAVALGVSQLAASASPEPPSLVGSVARLVIDVTPMGVVEWALSSLGGDHKRILVGGIVVVALVLGAAVGVCARRSRWWLVAGFGAFGALGALAAARDPRASLGEAVATALVAVVAGVATGGWLLRVVARERTGEPTGPANQSAGATSAPGAGTLVDRRAFVGWTLAAVGGAVAAWVGGRAVTVDRFRTARSAVRLPPASSPLVTPIAGASVRAPGVLPIVTPTRDFFRVDIEALDIPYVDPGRWRLRIHGMVEREVVLTLPELLAMPMREAYVTLCCVSNEVGGVLVSNALWQGVPLSALLERAGVDPRADQVVGRSVDGFTCGLPARAAFDGRTAMVAVGMNGEPLPAAHGFPARLVVAGLYGFTSATKWLAEIECTTFAAYDAYWVRRNWTAGAPVLTQSRIDHPLPNRRVVAGTVPVAGVAWAPPRGISRVEVRIDGEPWREARLAAALSDEAWRQWVLPWEATPGVHRLSVRATDGDGVTQTALRSGPLPAGATGHHTVTVRVHER